MVWPSGTSVPLSVSLTVIRCTKVPMLVAQLGLVGLSTNVGAVQIVDRRIFELSPGAHYADYSAR